MSQSIHHCFNWQYFWEQSKASHGWWGSLLYLGAACSHDYQLCTFHMSRRPNIDDPVTQLMSMWYNQWQHSIHVIYKLVVTLRHIHEHCARTLDMFSLTVALAYSGWNLFMGQEVSSVELCIDGFTPTMIRMIWPQVLTVFTWQKTKDVYINSLLIHVSKLRNLKTWKSLLILHVK